MPLSIFASLTSFILTAVIFAVTMFWGKAWPVYAENWGLIIIAFFIVSLVLFLLVDLFILLSPPFRYSFVNFGEEEKFFVIWVKRGKARILNKLGEASQEFSYSDIRPGKFDCWRWLSGGKYFVFPLYWKENISVSSEEDTVRIDAEISFRALNPGPEYFSRYQSQEDMRFFAKELSEKAARTALATLKWKEKEGITGLDQVASQIGLEIKQEIVAGKDLFNFETIELDLVFPAIRYPQ